VRCGVTESMRRSDWLFIIALVVIIVGAVGLMFDKLTYEQFSGLILTALALIGGGAYARKRKA